MWYRGHLLLTLCGSLTLISVGWGAKILLVPYPFNSHVSAQVNIGEALAERGHEVHAITSPSLPEISKFNKGKVKFMMYHAIDSDFYEAFDESALVEFIDHVSDITMKTDFRTSIEGFKEMCTNPLQDQDLYRKLKDMKFDIAIVDVFPCARCMLVLMHRLGLPYVSMEATDEPWLLRSPAIPSAWPTNMAGNPHTEKMSFWERLDNLWEVIDWAAFPGVSYIEDDFLEKFFYETTPVPINKLAGKSLLWLLETNPLLEYPRPRMPNEVLIGGLTTKPAKPLPDSMEKFMNSNPKGVVVVSFGSVASYLPEHRLNKLLESFKLLKYNFIMRYPLTPPNNIPSNVRLETWLPQNDLLGHKNTKVFITHCGANGQSEALYHGIPMVGMPVFADQPHNAKRMAYRGYGLALNFNSFTAEQLAKAIDEVASNSTYSANIQHASEIFKAQPATPRETAVYWIEHVIKYGGAHMRSHALDMPWYEYLMLDILVFIFTVFCICLIIIVCAIKKLISILRPNINKPKRE